MKTLSLFGVFVCLGGILLAADSKDPQVSGEKSEQESAGAPTGQFGGGFGGGGFGARSQNSALNDNVISSSHMVVAVSESGKTVHGYSDKTGEWTQVTLDEGDQSITPIVGREVAAFVSGTKAYAYSAQSGEWAQVTLEEGDPSIAPVVGQEVVALLAGTRAYAFGAESGTWSKAEVGAEATLRLGVRARIDAGSKIYLFSPASEDWAVVDLSKD